VPTRSLPIPSTKSTTVPTFGVVTYFCHGVYWAQATIKAQSLATGLLERESLLGRQGEAFQLLRTPLPTLSVHLSTLAKALCATEYLLHQIRSNCGAGVGRWEEESGREEMTTGGQPASDHFLPFPPG
jgi:hypothetical protein